MTTPIDSSHANHHTVPISTASPSRRTCIEYIQALFGRISSVQRTGAAATSSDTQNRIETVQAVANLALQQSQQPSQQQNQRSSRPVQGSQPTQSAASALPDPWETVPIPLPQQRPPPPHPINAREIPDEPTWLEVNIYQRYTAPPHNSPETQEDR